MSDSTDAPAPERGILSQIGDALGSSELETEFTTGGIEFKRPVVDEGVEDEGEGAEGEGTDEGGSPEPSPRAADEGVWGRADGTLEERYAHVRGWATRVAQTQTGLQDMVSELRGQVEELRSQLESRGGGDDEDGEDYDSPEDRRTMEIVSGVLKRLGVDPDRFVTKEEFTPIKERSDFAMEAMEVSKKFPDIGRYLPAIEVEMSAAAMAGVELTLAQAYTMAKQKYVVGDGDEGKKRAGTEHPGGDSPAPGQLRDAAENQTQEGKKAARKRDPRTDTGRTAPLQDTLTARRGDNPEVQLLSIRDAARKAMDDIERANRA